MGNSNKDIYKNQDEMVADWIEFISEIHYPASKIKKKEDISEELEVRQKEVCKKTMKTISKGNFGKNKFLDFIKRNKFNETEIKIIMILYLKYLHNGYQRGQTIISILNDVIKDKKTAYIERKNIKKRGKLFKSGAIINEEVISPFRSGEVSYILSSELLSMLEGEKINFEEGELDLFEVIEPRKSLNDIVLSYKSERQIELILRQIQEKELFLNKWGFGEKFEKGKGFIIMFYGPPGTGKTLAAEAIAHKLNYKLYIVSLSDMLNPFYGITEKNIKRIFEEASGRDAILLLDEVDAFISKRSKGGTCWDTSHNRKISMFLRSIENYEGVIILTTNLPDVLDFALRRRVSIKVEFPKPDFKMRKKLWKVLIPDKLPVSKDVNFEQLAKDYELTGGEIKNVIMNAARICLLRDEKVLMMDDFLNALNYEIQEDIEVGFKS